MKKHLNILALAAVLVAIAVPAFAQFSIHIPDFGRTASPRLRWVKGATTDSTEVAIVVWGGAVTVAAASDTTEWYAVGRRYEFPQPGFTAAPILQFQVNHQIGAATDSIGYILQYKSDPNTTAFHQTATQHVPTNGAAATVIDAMTSSGPAGSDVRLILINNKIASGVTRKYSVVPIIRGRLKS
jgi:hypothetical protein